MHSTFALAIVLQHFHSKPKNVFVCVCVCATGEAVCQLHAPQLITNTNNSVTLSRCYGSFDCTCTNEKKTLCFLLSYTSFYERFVGACIALESLHWETNWNVANFYLTFILRMQIDLCSHHCIRSGQRPACENQIGPTTKLNEFTSYAEKVGNQAWKINDRFDVRCHGAEK